MNADKSVPADQILHGETLYLCDEIHIFYDTTTAEISTGQVASDYAAMMQLGGITSPLSMIPGVEIPARPYFGFSDSDQGEIITILGEFLTQI